MAALEVRFHGVLGPRHTVRHRAAPRGTHERLLVTTLAGGQRKLGGVEEGGEVRGRDWGLAACPALGGVRDWDERLRTEAQ
jgi:hypothetical protein